MFYCALLALGVWWIIERNDLATADFRAHLDLPANRLLRDGDVEGPVGPRGALLADRTQAKNFNGRYMVAAMSAGAQFRIGATDTMPRLTPRAGFHMLLATLPRGGLATVNAGSCIRLSGKDDRPVLVRTVICAAVAGPACVAVIEVESQRAPALVAETVPLTVAAAAECP
jgi:hypothetical protein